MKLIDTVAIIGFLNTNIETYKFSVEKTVDGIAVDVAFRAILKMEKA